MKLRTVLWAELQPLHSYIEILSPGTLECDSVVEIESLKR